MRVGFVGIGKLGLPCAVGSAMKGHDVMGYDIVPTRMTYGPHPEVEAGPDGTGEYNTWLSRYSGGEWVDKGRLRFGDLAQLADHSEIIFIAAQTPHNPAFEGITRLPDERVDFDYEWLKASVRAVSAALTRPTPVVIISTVLPGTVRREILPLCGEHVRLCYNPFFIAMGTTMRDFLRPEFVLFGRHDAGAGAVAKAFYAEVHGDSVPVFETSIENAELIKVIYNTYISQKIAFINTVMEVCHKMPGCNVDAVSDAIALAGNRLVSTMYLRGGMGDGGGCHPRDNIALSWLARKLDLSHDIFEDAMLAREHHTEFLADLMEAEGKRRGLPLGIFGFAFKAGTRLTVGSPSLLLREVLKERGHDVRLVDPHVNGETADEPRVWLLGCNHPDINVYAIAPGSVRRRSVAGAATSRRRNRHSGWRRTGGLRRLRDQRSVNKRSRLPAT